MMKSNDRPQNTFRPRTMPPDPGTMDRIRFDTFCQCVIEYGDDPQCPSCYPDAAGMGQVRLHGGPMDAYSVTLSQDEYDAAVIICALARRDMTGIHNMGFGTYRQDPDRHPLDWYWHGPDVTGMNN